MGTVIDEICCIKEEEVIDKFDYIQGRSALSSDNKTIEYLLPLNEMTLFQTDNIKLQYSNSDDIPITSETLIKLKFGNPISHYIILKKVGEGSYGTVYKVKHKVNGAIRALKEIPKLNTIEDDSLQNEIYILKKLNHPYVVKLYEFYSDPVKNCYYLVSEFCEEGDLAFKFYNFKEYGNLPEYFVSNIMKQIFQALNYLHTNRVIHGDLKLENILIGSFDNDNIPSSEIKDEYIDAILHDAKILGIDIKDNHKKRLSLPSKNSFSHQNMVHSLTGKNVNVTADFNKLKFGKNESISERFSYESLKKEIKNQNKLIFGNYRIKITDFGCSKIQTHYRKIFHDTVGTLLYCAPENLCDSYNEKMDIWACGIIMYRLLTGISLFDGFNEEIVKQNIMNEEVDLGPKIKISVEAKELIKQCLHKNMNKRISAQEALNSKFIKKYDNKEKNQYTEREKDILTNFKNGILEKVRLVELSEQKNDKNNIQENEKYDRIKGKIIDSKLYQIVLAYLSNNYDNQTLIRELTDLFNKIDKDSNGVITGKDLYKAYEEAEIEITYEEILKIVDYIDFDKNEHLQFQEFVRVNFPIKDLFNDNNLQEAFDLLDKDKNDTIVPSEIKEFLGLEKGSVMKNEVKLMRVDSKPKKELHFDEFKEKMKMFL